MDHQSDSQNPMKPNSGFVLLICWNLVCFAVPIVMWFQPSPEPAIAKAVVLVVFAGPALWLAFVANVIYWFRQRPRSVKRLSFGLTIVTGVMALVWLVEFLRA